jgi:type 1 glutamine amidotransferase
MRRAVLIVAVVVAAAVARGQEPLPIPASKKVLVLGDTHTGNTHEALGHMMAVIDQLGRKSGLFDTYIRTDSHWINKQPIPNEARRKRVKNLDDFEAVVLMTNGQPGWTPQQKEDFLSFVRDDGKGVVVAHMALGTFYDWPEFGEMMGGYFDNHPWGNAIKARVIVEASDFPAMRHFPKTFERTEEFYVLREKPYSREKVRVLARLDPSSVDLKHPNYKRKDADLPVAMARTYGKGRTFWSNFGHTAETWDDPDIQTHYLEAIKWAMGLIPGDATPRPGPVPEP